MKHVINPIMLMLLLAVALGTACSTSRERAAYNTLYAVGVSVDAAMTSYGQAVQMGLVSIEDQKKVKALHDRYQPLFRTSVRLAQFDLDQSTPAELGALAAELTLLIGELIE